VDVLGKLDDTRAVDALVSALKDPDLNVRYQAANSLGEKGDIRAEDTLIAALSHSGRLKAVDALGKITGIRLWMH
jgi:HEAT repeat protein